MTVLNALIRLNLLNNILCDGDIEKALNHATAAMEKQIPKELQKPYDFKRVLNKDTSEFETYAFGKCACGYTVI